jgi:ketosteroid isomerase-like protein
VTRESEDIRDLVERWAAAVRAKDIAGIIADHSPEVRFFDVPTT